MNIVKKQISYLLIVVLSITMLFSTSVMTVGNVYASDNLLDGSAIPSKHFREKIYQHIPDLSDTFIEDGPTDEDITSIAAFNGVLDLESWRISDATGIKLFSSVEEINLFDNHLRSLDVSGMTSLKKLTCTVNYLETLNVSGLSSLEELSCSSNKLAALDASGLTSLKKLHCDNNKLETINVSGATSLTDLSCFFNNLTQINVNGLTELSSLNCGFNELTALDVREITTLNDLSCNSNLLTSLDVSNNTALVNLLCDNNQLKYLDVSNLTSLESLECYANELTTLDVSKVTSLKKLDCINNQLTTLDTSMLNSLEFLACRYNQLTTLKVSKSGNLGLLSCSNNKLSSLDLGDLKLVYNNLSPQTGGTLTVPHQGNGIYSLSIPNATDIVATGASVKGNTVTLADPAKGGEVAYTYKTGGKDIDDNDINMIVSINLVAQKTEITPDPTPVKPPKSTSIKKIKAQKKKAKISWKKSADANGYQVVFSTKKNKGFKSAGHTTKLSLTKKKLKSKKTYYFKVRPYKTIDGKKVYGKYSKVKKAKIK